MEAALGDWWEVARTSELAHNYATFRFDARSTPLASRRACATSVVCYLLLAIGLQALQRKSVPMNLGPLPSVHNLILCSGSGVMFVGAAFEAWREYQRAGSSEFLFCLPPGFAVQGPLYWWSYVYYLSKYYELLDTAILVLRGKGLNFLHVFHHAFVMVMAYLVRFRLPSHIMPKTCIGALGSEQSQWLEQAQSLQTVALLTNTGIHVIMYWYFFLVSIGFKPAWKRLVTQAQIVQFIFSFVNAIPFIYLHCTKPGGCGGKAALLFNATFNLALVLLFGNFFKRNYSRASAKSKKP